MREKGRPFGALVSLALALAPAAAGAHHSFGMFDKDSPMEISGTIKEFQWVNPHSWVQIMVPDEDGEAVEWSIEGRSPNVLSRRGWTRNTLEPGDDVTLTIYPLRNGDPGGAIAKIVFADGTVLDADTPTAVDTDEEVPR